MDNGLMPINDTTEKGIARTFLNQIIIFGLHIGESINYRIKPKLILNNILYTTSHIIDNILKSYPRTSNPKRKERLVTHE